MTLNPKPKLLFLMGPTATGKSDLALKLLERVPCELISVDSALVYRNLDIGTAKPSAELRQRIPYHLIDIRSPKESYSAAAFRNDACRLINDILERGKLPLLVGGSGLYFRALEWGLAKLPSGNPSIRAKLHERLEREGLPALHMELSRIDPISTQRIHANDTQRTLRALEVWLETGTPMSTLLEEAETKPTPYNIVKCALAPTERATLHSAIQQRFDAMLEAGFLDEVRELRAQGNLHAKLPAMRLVGYHQAWAHLNGDFDFETMRSKIIVATRQLAKRQYTWLRGDSGINWHDPKDPASLEAILRRWLG
ncbi:MAG: tRNA (adenosine(37)-N6)-dimethylallyltransferase MiaA [Candidatus Eutrophobiaceae bacterium]